jgi:hypothetical protein
MKRKHKCTMNYADVAGDYCGVIVEIWEVGTD